MTSNLFTSAGERKYLTVSELEKFIAAAEQHERGEVRTLCLVLAYSGCRISEALALRTDRVDLSAKALTFETLKQRRAGVYRSVPVPDRLLDALELVHGVRKAQRARKPALLWSWGRTQAYNHVKDVMELAGLVGTQASPKGLRHGFGVKAASKTRHPRMVQKWLGHRSLETTAIYMDAQGDEEREVAAQMWES